MAKAATAPGRGFWLGMSIAIALGACDASADPADTGRGEVDAIDANDTRAVQPIETTITTDSDGDPGPAPIDDAQTGADASGTCPPAEPIFVGIIKNARGLGGTPLEGGGRVACGELYRGGPLAFTNPAGCDELERVGIRTVIDLREPQEQSARPNASCVRDRTHIVSASMPIPYAVDGPAYLRDLHTAQAILPAFAALGDDDAYPIYFHCTYGRDRTGVLAAVILLVLGATPDEIMREYQLTAESGLGAYPQSLSAVLSDIASRGGVDAYLADIGVPAGQVAVLRRRGIASP